MKNIVWSTPDGDKILDRMAAILRDYCGWEVSDRPRKDADLNFFPVYVTYAQKFSDWRHTPIAAYFSHYEPDEPYKKMWWQKAAELVDYKIVTADKYAGILTGNIRKVVPPLGKFRMRSNPQNQVPRIGTSGFVYSTGRKGEELLGRLDRDLGGDAEVVASGEGWPVRIVNTSAAGMQAFYDSLDIYVCTSLIEGVPMGPLEALACGKMIVIPRDVGMLDELGKRQGIFRYEAGNYEDLRKTIGKALQLRQLLTPQREALVDLVAGFGEKQFAEGVRMGLDGAQRAPDERIMQGRVESDHHGGKGVLYVAYGKPARECAMGAIASFKKHMPGVPVALVGSERLGPEDIFIEHPDTDIGGRSAKTLIDQLAPKEWQYVMYLDVDTQVVAPIHFLFDVLADGFDMVICKNPGRFHVASQMVRSDNKDECDATFRLLGTDQMIQLNGGVFAYQRNSRTGEFFHRWHQEWMVYGKRDQAALLRALNTVPLKMYVLGKEWNTITRYDDEALTAGILHFPMNARRWRGVIEGRSDSPEAWQAVVE